MGKRTSWLGRVGQQSMEALMGLCTLKVGHMKYIYITYCVLVISVLFQAFCAKFIVQLGTVNNPRTYLQCGIQQQICHNDSFTTWQVERDSLAKKLFFWFFFLSLGREDTSNEFWLITGIQWTGLWMYYPFLERGLGIFLACGMPVLDTQLNPVQ